MALETHVQKITKHFTELGTKVSRLFFRKSDMSAKIEINFKTIRTLALTFFFIFVTVVMLMPDERPVEFSEKRVSVSESKNSEDDIDLAEPTKTTSGLWASQRSPSYGPSGSGTQINHNTSMILGAKSGNARVQLRAGVRLPLRIMDKFIVSNESVPILAELLLDATTDAGLRLPAGTKFYGEASFQKGGERASIQFRQISLPDGQIRPLTGLAMGKDGQPGIPGRIYSDGLKNTAGSVVTTFVGGLAAGSVETDFMGRSRGGIENGLLTAVAAAAKERAQAYGEKMKTEREWIEVAAGAECDALLSESLNLQQGLSE
jgi:hypothetical protein